MVMFGTKWPSMMSTWSQSAPCSIFLEQSWPRSAKLALRMDGAMMAGGAILEYKRIVWGEELRGREEGEMGGRRRNNKVKKKLNRVIKVKLPTLSCNRVYIRLSGNPRVDMPGSPFTVWIPCPTYGVDYVDIGCFMSIKGMFIIPPSIQSN